jgi:hypothetical protein
MAVNVQSEAPGASKISGDTLLLESVKILLKRVRLHQAVSYDSADVDEGPLAVSLNLSGGKTRILLSTIPAGTYDRVKFRVHRPEDLEPIPDPIFRDGPSGDQRYSVVIQGVWNGVPFTYRSRRGTEQDLTLIPPLRVGGGTIVTVTLRVNPYGWFEEGGTLLNPMDESDAERIDDRIKDSFGRASVDEGTGYEGAP